jgi:hypothetical protein
MMRFFGILFLAYLAWRVYTMFRDVMRGSVGVERGSREMPQEGDVTIQRTQRQPEKRVNDDVGEYVDYKEIKK